MKVQDKVIIVTGGGSGMGRELVLNLLNKGAKVVAVDINQSALEETFTLTGNNRSSLKTSVLNITNRTAVEHFLEEAIAYWGQVDGVINNAGIIQPFLKLNDLSYEDIQRVMDVNFYGTLYMVKTFLPHLLTRPEAHILNISSMGGFLPVPGQTIYGATKAAVKLFTEGLYSELRDTKVNVTIAFPGAVSTNIMSNSGLKMAAATQEQEKAAKVLSAADAAQIMVAGIEKNSYRVMVGKDAKFLDIFYRLNPKSAADFIANKMKSYV